MWVAFLIGYCVRPSLLAVQIENLAKLLLKYVCARRWRLCQISSCFAPQRWLEGRTQTAWHSNKEKGGELSNNTSCRSLASTTNVTWRHKHGLPATPTNKKLVSLATDTSCCFLVTTTKVTWRQNIALPFKHDKVG